MVTYYQARQALGGRNFRKVEGNTYIRQDSNGDVILTFYQTDIVTWLPDGRIILNNGGWFTSNTNIRIVGALNGNMKTFEHQPGPGVSISSNSKSGWRLECAGVTYDWSNGDKPCIHPDGKVTGVPTALQKIYREKIGCTLEAEQLPEAISGMDLKQFRKLWGGAAGCRVELVSMAPQEFLPLIIGFRTNDRERHQVKEALADRLQNG